MATPIVLEKADNNNAVNNFLNICSIFVLYILIHKYVLQDVFQYFQDNTTISYFNITSRTISIFLFILLLFSGYSISKGHVHSNEDTVKIAIYFFTLILGTFSVLGMNILYNTNQNYFFGLLALIIILISGYIFFTNKNEKVQKLLRLTGFVITAVITICAIGYGIYNSYQNYPSYTILGVSLMVLLAIFFVFYYGINTINIGYIFSKLQNGINELINDYQRTPSSTKMFIVFQIFVLVLYFVFHIIFNSATKINYPKGKYLLKNKVPLSESRIIADYNDIKPYFDSNSQASKKGKFDYSYSMSMFFKINSETNVDSFINLFHYGKNPAIEYAPTHNQLRILVRNNKMNDNQRQIYLTKDLLYQRWNHLVINYHNAQLDIFVNNKLVHSEENILPYMEEDSIIVGSNNNVSGDIKNIVYFKKPLSLSAIQKLYFESEHTMNKPLIMNQGIFDTLFGKLESGYKKFDETIQEKIN